MLVPLTREKLEQIIPFSATAEQYRYYWGKFPDVLQRVLISVIGVVVIWVFELVIGGYQFLALPLGVTAGLYWLWNPVLRAGMRNATFRKYPYAGFWRGEVLDAFVTEELIGKEETVNDRGELVIVENRERRINLEISDESGFTRSLQAALQREHQRIAPGQIAELVVLSNRPDLERIAQVTDVYIPSLKIWVSDYPYLNRNMFEAVSRQLSKSSQRRSRQDDYDREDDQLDGDDWAYMRSNGNEGYLDDYEPDNAYEDDYEPDNAYDSYDAGRALPRSVRGKQSSSTRRSASRRKSKTNPDDWTDTSSTPSRRRTKRPNR
jgi:hypothetical protein